MKIAVGLSGGVDSAVTASLLQEQGHDLVGVYLECWRAPGCRAEEDRADAVRVAAHLGIPFTSVDLRAAYKQDVVDRYLAGLKTGVTPNPDVWCNEVIKFGLFLEWTQQKGFERIATGHYVLGDGNGNIFIPKDKHKDQTYFLSTLSKKQLSMAIFPLGVLLKSEVRVMALERGLPVAKKKDSTGICFIGEHDQRAFLQEHLGEQEGEVVDVDGEVVGRHPGHWFFTIGQRHGFELFPKIRKNGVWRHVLPPLYVVAKDAKANRLTVGFGVEALTTTLTIAGSDLGTTLTPLEEYLMSFSKREGSALPEEMPLVRIRHGGCLLELTKIDYQEGTFYISLAEPQRGVAPGQTAVFYKKDGQMMGGSDLGTTLTD